MPASDVIALPLKLGSAVRRGRVFHPIGVLATGSLERIAPPGTGLAVESSEVVGRVSKGIGLPGGLPDIIGLAIRIPPPPFAAVPWDILMASAGSSRLSRFALRPVRSWCAPMSTLMPLRYSGKYWWLQARMTIGPEASGLALDDIAEQIRDGGVEFVLEQATATTGFAPLARIRLSEGMREPTDIAFDPTIHTAPDVRLAPEWLTSLRQRAYQRSREGRSRTQ